MVSQSSEVQSAHTSTAHMQLYCRAIGGESFAEGRAVGRLHGVGGGAQVIFGGRRRRAAGPKKSAAAARGRPKTVFSKIYEQISFYPQNFLRNLFSHQSFEVCR